MANDRQNANNQRSSRPYLNMHFTCCNVYRRIYLNAAGDAFAGHCPRCAAPVKIRVSSSGASSKFWSAG